MCENAEGNPDGADCGHIGAVQDSDWARRAVCTSADAINNSGAGGRQDAAVVEVDVMVGIDGRERDGVARSVGAWLGVDAVDRVVDVEMADRRGSCANVTGAGEGGRRAWMSQSAEQKRRGERSAEQESLAVGVSQAWEKCRRAGPRGN